MRTTKFSRIIEGLLNLLLAGYHGVVGSTSDGCSLLSLTLLFGVTMWHGESTSRRKHGRKFVRGDWSWTTFRLEYI